MDEESKESLLGRVGANDFERCVDGPRPTLSSHPLTSNGKMKALSTLSGVSILSNIILAILVLRHSLVTDSCLREISPFGLAARLPNLWWLADFAL